MADKAEAMQNNHRTLPQKWGLKNSYLKRTPEIEDHQRRPQRTHKDFQYGGQLCKRKYHIHIK